VITVVVAVVLQQLFIYLDEGIEDIITAVALSVELV